MKKVIAVVLAAGKGSRMQSKVHKQYMLLEGKPVLYYAMACFQNSKIIDEIMLVTGADEIAYCENEIVEPYHFTKVTKIIPGGKERYESVYHALIEIKEDAVVMIHDGARPFVTEQMIKDSVEAAAKYGACTVGVPAKDTMKRINDDGFGVETPDRKYMWNIQTPQTFDAAALKRAYEVMLSDNADGITDDTMIMERYGNSYSKVIEGSYKNIKITTPEDMQIARIFLDNQA